MLNITVDRNDERSLYIQIKDSILLSIKKGELNEGDRLPTVVGLAKQIGVTQATVNRAFEELAKGSWIISYVGRGTFVSTPKNQSVEDNVHYRPSSTRQPWDTANSEYSLAARRMRMGLSKSLDSLWPLARKPGLIQFVSGVPDPSIANNNILKKLTTSALKKDQKLYQVYGDHQGMFELRSAIAERYSKSGVFVNPDQIIITCGSQQAISILSQEARDNNTKIICETPNYKGVPNAFGAAGHWVETIPRNEFGPDIKRLNKYNDHSYLFYLCPEMHNPMGTDTSTENLKLIAKWAKDRKATLLSDEIFKDLRFSTKQSPPSLYTLAGPEHTVLVGSFSKSFMCGLRVGWLVTGRERIRSILELKQAIDISCPPLMQGIALELLHSGEYDKHLIKAREHYKIRRDCVLSSLQKHLPNSVKWTVPPGGFHMWCELPPGYSSIALYLIAIERGVVIGPGPNYDIDHRFMNAFNLGYGSLSLDKIQKGIELLSGAIMELLSSSPADSGLTGLGNFN